MSRSAIEAGHWSALSHVYGEPPRLRRHQCLKAPGPQLHFEFGRHCRRHRGRAVGRRARRGGGDAVRRTKDASRAEHTLKDSVMTNYLNFVVGIVDKQLRDTPEDFALWYFLQTQDFAYSVHPRGLTFLAKRFFFAAYAKKINSKN